MSLEVSPRMCLGVGNGTTFILQLGHCEVTQGEKGICHAQPLHTTICPFWQGLQ